MKVAVNFSIDVTKLDKTRFKSGKNGGKYVDLTCFISPEEPDQYGQHGAISQSSSKEERDSGIQMPFVGNCKAFWGDGVIIIKQQQQQQAPQQQQQQAPQSGGHQSFDDDIPF
tara:strand:- start:48 stop:386 length:339 start_codon:yes stop_codon:yes gene_type:complete